MMRSAVPQALLFLFLCSLATACAAPQDPLHYGVDALGQTDEGAYGIYNGDNKLVGYLISLNNRSDSGLASHAVELLVSLGDGSSTSPQPFIDLDQFRLQGYMTVAEVLAHCSSAPSIQGCATAFAKSLTKRKNPKQGVHYVVYRSDVVYEYDIADTSGFWCFSWLESDAVANGSRAHVVSEPSMSQPAWFAGRRSENISHAGWSLGRLDELYLSGPDSPPFPFKSYTVNFTSVPFNEDCFNDAASCLGDSATALGFEPTEFRYARVTFARLSPADIKLAAWPLWDYSNYSTAQYTVSAQGHCPSAGGEHCDITKFATWIDAHPNPDSANECNVHQHSVGLE